MADRVAKMASQRVVVIFSASNCCMCHAAKTLFTELGVSWVVHELDKDPRGKNVEMALASMVGRNRQCPPAIFIGSRLVGPTDKVMTLHLGGQLAASLPGELLEI